MSKELYEHMELRLQKYEFTHPESTLPIAPWIPAFAGMPENYETGRLDFNIPADLQN